MKQLYLILAALMLLCLAPMPYGYYMLVRFVAMVMFGVMAYRYYTNNKGIAAAVFGVLALLFQPIYKIALGRGLWNLVDLLVAALLVSLFFLEKRLERETTVRCQALTPRKREENEIDFKPGGILDSKELVYVASDILLPDYNNMEIKMEPLVKAVYLLFLRHPEGIMFKRLPDYRQELTQIYNDLRPSGLTERAVQSIEDVTNPMLNSINEKCARIRAAFVGQFDEYMARSYYIDGLRGQAKKIALPRSLVVWE